MSWNKDFELEHNVPEFGMNLKPSFELRIELSKIMLKLLSGNELRFGAQNGVFWLAARARPVHGACQLPMEPHQPKQSRIRIQPCHVSALAVATSTLDSDSSTCPEEHALLKRIAKTMMLEIADQSPNKRDSVGSVKRWRWRLGRHAAVLAVKDCTEHSCRARMIPYTCRKK